MPWADTRTVACDEYPFAASTQGAANSNGHYSLRAVKYAHNKAHGTALNQFFTRFHVGEGNKFWVLIDP
ncbi:NucA/NucB deoxyribonuclease domain-containing protein [Nonomuraea rubra]|uniref:NucA/NucB deoxyribonuclease domain-containing protein n=1 Tax=Nonomuraea rubra TaxID=46180 RepID=UPI003615D225